MSLGHSMVMFMRMLCCGQGCCEGCCWRRSWSQMCCSARCCLECSEGEQERDGRQNLQSCYDDSKNILVQLFWTLEEYHSAVVFICVYWHKYKDIMIISPNTVECIQKSLCARSQSCSFHARAPFFVSLEKRRGEDFLNVALSLAQSVYALQTKLTSLLHGFVKLIAYISWPLSCPKSRIRLTKILKFVWRRNYR